jgi:two-component system chemotaxis sensor kinase CheA
MSQQTINVSPVALEPFARIIDQLSAFVMAADVDDLATLAASHTCFQQLVAEASVTSDLSVRQRVAGPAGEGAKLVERLILRELSEPEAALRLVNQAVCDLQAYISQPAGVPAVGSAEPAKEAPPVAPATAAVSSAHALAESGTALNADDVPLALEFISEANAHVEAAEGGLLKLEETPGDPETVNAIFRSFHTVKGGAGFLNFKQIGALAHAAENLLDLARKGKLELVGGVVDVILESLDVLKALLAALDVAIKEHQPIGPEPRLPDLIDRLHAAAGDAPATHAAPVPVAPAPAPAAVAHPTAAAAAPAAAAPAPVAPAHDVAHPPAAEAAKPHPPAATAAAGKGQDASHGDGTVKVSMERLDSLINMVGELVISQSMVSQDVASIAPPNHRVVRNLSHLGKITRELQDLSMSMRMVPVQGVFQKMARVVRDISHKAGKEVEFVVVGGETELDRNVVEAIGDPLVHMVRNSLDHGIETPEQRLAAGKSRQGKLELRARHQAGQIVIEIVDDGRGLNTARILKKAIENGLVKEGDPITEQQIFQLIFAAGLSTAEKITDISGRGVGMDVVRRNIDALRGRIDIDSVAGLGTTFTISLPLTMAVIDGMVVRVGGERYIIPINSIEQSIRPKPDQLSSVQGKGELCMVRGRLLPLVRLHRLFHVTPRTENPTEALVVIVHDNNRASCLLVDELVGQQQVVIKSLGDSVGTVPGVSGGAILGDGTISLILDVPAVIGLAESH